MEFHLLVYEACSPGLDSTDVREPDAGHCEGYESFAPFYLPAVALKKFPVPTVPCSTRVVPGDKDKGEEASGEAGEKVRRPDPVASGTAVAKSLLAGLSKRFSSEEMKVFDASRIFDPQSYKFGIQGDHREHFVFLCTFFSDSKFGDDRLLDRAALTKILGQFNLLQKDLCSSVQSVRDASFSAFWEEIQKKSTWALKFREVLKLVQLVAVMCGSQAEVERGFSVHKNIKCPTRNRLASVHGEGVPRAGLRFGRGVPRGGRGATDCPYILAPLPPYPGVPRVELREGG